MLETTVAAIAVAVAVGALVLMALSSVLPDLLDGYANRTSGSSGPGVTDRRDRCPDNGDSSVRGRRSGAELALLEPRSPVNQHAPRPGLG